MHILHGLTDGDVLHLLLHGKRCHVTDGLRRTVAVQQQVGRGSDVCQFLAAGDKALQRVVGDIVHKRTAHLRGHKRMRDAVLFEVFVQRNQVEAQFLGDDIQGGTHHECRPDLLQRRVETEAGIRTDAAVRFHMQSMYVCMAERHHVTLLQLTALGHTCRTAGVYHRKQALGLGPLHVLYVFDVLQPHDIAGQQNVAMILVHDGAQVLVGYQQLRA